MLQLHPFHRPITCVCIIRLGPLTNEMVGVFNGLMMGWKTGILNPLELSNQINSVYFYILMGVRPCNKSLERNWKHSNIQIHYGMSCHQARHRQSCWILHYVLQWLPELDLWCVHDPTNASHSSLGSTKSHHVVLSPSMPVHVLWALRL